MYRRDHLKVYCEQENLRTLPLISAISPARVCTESIKVKHNRCSVRRLKARWGRAVERPGIDKTNLQQLSAKKKRIRWSSFCCVVASAGRRPHHQVYF